ncbi:trypsin-like serine protease [Actinoplanes sp. NPDC048796]|uniref:trypsin-like serine protease n=1 Tax=unclassified Actinoplanes TaxID=2626549 RepID=UPI0033C72DA9
MTKTPARAALTAALMLLGLAVVPASARAVTGDTVDATADYVQPLVVGDGAKAENFFGCTASQIERDYALTTATCLRASGAAPATDGSAPLRLTTFGRYQVLSVGFHPTRDVALLHLDQGNLGPTTSSVQLAGTPAAAGETLSVLGAGRTGTQWLPNGPHSGSFAVQSAGDTVTLTATGDASVCPGDAGGPVVRTVSGVPTLVAMVTTAAPAGCLGSAAEQGHAATAVRVDDLGLWIKSRTGHTSFEATDPAVVPNISAGAGMIYNVGGVIASVSGPELGIRTQRARTGTRSVLYSGKDLSSISSYAHLKLASTPNILVDGRTVLEYSIFPEGGSGSLATGNNSTCVAIDLEFTDGTRLRSLKATASNGVDIHPSKQCGHLTLNTWNHVRVQIGRVAAGKRIKQVNVAYDQPANLGGYRGFIDDVTLYHGCVAVGGTLCALNNGVIGSGSTTEPADPASVSFDDPAPVAEQSMVDNMAYPGAERILAEQKVKLISGDGRLLLADCSVPKTGPYEYIRLRTSDLTVGTKGQLCFDIDRTVKFGRGSATAMLKLEVPGAYAIRSDGYEDGVGSNINVVWKTKDTAPQKASVPQNGYLSIGIAAPDGSGVPATVLQLLVLP